MSFAVLVLSHSVPARPATPATVRVNPESGVAIELQVKEVFQPVLLTQLLLAVMLISPVSAQEVQEFAAWLGPFLRIFIPVLSDGIVAS